MCGIYGFFSAQVGADPFEAENIVRRATAQMKRRGPDDEGLWSDAEQCAFGFRRLSILDLSESGHQPMLTADGRFALVFNGEVYNFEEIREELKGQGVRFRSTGDAEVVLHSLARWGADALQRFNGMFALAFYDAREKGLLLARDHAGIKPLYYMHGSKGLVFASQYDQLLGHPWAKELLVSEEALSLYLRFGHIPAPYAMLEQTSMLDAGCWLSINRRGGLKQGCHYEFPKFGGSNLKGEAVVDALDEALSRAVRRHLVSDVPVGVLLSGGVDSPLVAAEAACHSTQPLKAFSIGVPGSEADESSEAVRYSRELNLEHVLRMADERSALELLDDVVEACTEPTADYSIFPTLLVSRLAREHVKVVLSGDGGDELFWGYPSRFGSVIEQAPYFDMPKLARYWHIFGRRYLKRGHATRDVLWPSIGRLYQKKHTIMAEGDLSSCFANLVTLPADFELFDYRGNDPAETAHWLRWNEFRLHLAGILLKVDRASMHHSLEVRVPLLDKEVIGVAAQTDWRSCLDLRGRRGKIPLRGSLSRRLNYQTRAKKGFTVPMHEWLAGPLQALLREKVLNRREFLSMEVDSASLRRLNGQLLAGDRYVAWGLWLLLSLALWEEKYFARRRAARAA